LSQEIFRDEAPHPGAAPEYSVSLYYRRGPFYEKITLIWSFYRESHAPPETLPKGEDKIFRGGYFAELTYEGFNFKLKL
jgi:hypothetical protein